MSHAPESLHTVALQMVDTLDQMGFLPEITGTLRQAIQEPMAQPVALTSDGIPPGPLSEHDLRQQWNAQADEYNQWDSLDSCEQLAWAQARAIAADRAALAQPVAEGPTDEELRDLWSWSAAQDQGPWPTQQHCFARAALARWGHRTPQPIPVGERLPGERERNGEGEAWVEERGYVYPLGETGDTKWIPTVRTFKPAFGGPIPDWRIRQLGEAGMISPFEPRKIKHINVGSPIQGGGQGVTSAISYGTSSYGYDLTLSPNDFRVFRHVPGLIVNPKSFDDRCLAPAELQEDQWGQFFILPGHTYALGVVIPRLRLPANVTAQFIGKSTYARCGIIVNLTPGEAGWEGHLTLEISNSSGADCRIYANEGICQALFYESVPCDQPYGDGKYQGQAGGVTLARV